MTRVAVLNGPNLDLLGVREPERYGRTTFAELEALVRREAEALGVTLAWHQTNHEGVFLDTLRDLRGAADGCLINAAAWTHTSLALRDAVLALPVPFVEVHLTNLFAREAERQRSLIADRAVGFVCGFGVRGYVHALRALVEHLGGRS
ncbi:MAG TPA: type II 3-dehydroquinate dehydratase [Gemmatimonadales bacterium]|nr:type II 3-dehydroquinate dehydratase [Gemmatimonadales bacterium]